ncbi:hypothetical protein [Priestia flexa]|uniref:hypothetical protein n=1 Tax=Priestia flexa TaxID=86664 RepID=UPI001B33CEFF|nr:hypothetical protein [Priestia flexa]
MRKLVIAVITFAALLGINYAVSYPFKVGFIDYSTIVGFLGAGLIWFFTSSGGYTSKHTDVMIQVQTTNFKMKEEKHSFSLNSDFVTAIIYTTISLFVTLYTYKDYF